MKIIANNSILVFQNQVNTLTKVHEVVKSNSGTTNQSKGRFDFKIDIDPTWGTTELLVKVTKRTGATGNTYAIWGYNNSADQELFQSLNFGELSQLHDFDGYSKIFLYATGLGTAVATEILVEIFKYTTE